MNRVLYNNAVLFLYVFIFLSSNQFFGQKIVFHDLKKPLNNEYEFSSMRIRNDSIFIVSESCNTMFICDMETKEILKQAPILKTKQNTDIEGFFLLKNKMFYTDESKPHSRIFFTELYSSTRLSPKYKQTFEPRQSGNFGTGLEGLEINSISDYVYAIREKNTKGDKSYIYCFNMKLKKDACKLNLDKTIKIEIPSGQRYSDLALSTDGKRLYLLRTKENHYFIDTINIEKNGRFKKENYKTTDLTSINISNAINEKAKEGYGSNLEGIATYKNSIYLISDNKFGSGNCNLEKDKTMLVEIKL